jgi:hypothetical protein
MWRKELPFDEVQMIICRRFGQVIVDIHQQEVFSDQETVVLELSWNGLHWFRQTNTGQLIKLRKLKKGEETLEYVSGRQWMWDDELS